jgi:hypothetical protein
MGGTKSGPVLQKYGGIIGLFFYFKKSTVLVFSNES